MESRGFTLLKSTPETEAFLNEWYNDKPFIVAYTSGSTGKPKKIELLKSDVINSAQATNKFFNIDRSSLLICPLSCSYIAGKMMVVRAIQADCALMMLTPSNHFMLDVDREISLLSIVPSQIEQIINCVDTVCVKNLLVGGAPISDRQRTTLLKAGINAYLSYGMTETCSHVALQKVGEPNYKALPGITFKTDDRGCLIINAPNLSFLSLTTNDIVSLDSATSFVWQGRFDNVINSGGVKVFPEIIEQKLEPVLSPQNYYVIRQSNDKWGEVPVLVIEGDNLPVSDDLTCAIRQVLLPAERPKKIYVVNRFNYTDSGKIIREIPLDISSI